MPTFAASNAGAGCCSAWSKSQSDWQTEYALSHCTTNLGIYEWFHSKFWTQQTVVNKPHKITFLFLVLQVTYKNDQATRLFKMLFFYFLRLTAPQVERKQ